MPKSYQNYYFVMLLIIMLLLLIMLLINNLWHYWLFYLIDLHYVCHYRLREENYEGPIFIKKVWGYSHMIIGALRGLGTYDF